MRLKSNGFVLGVAKIEKPNGDVIYLDDDEYSMKIYRADEVEEVNPKPYDLFPVECAQGWRKVIEPLFDYIEEYNKDKDTDDKIIVEQVKEKFGELRFYTNFNEETLGDMIGEAEDKADHTCEYCGSEEDVYKVSRSGWIKTLCQKCADKYGYTRGKFFKKNVEKPLERE
ncbi:MAG: hypothetical protein LUD72_04115 [Bacteroidales bacterium]|nr:hypothetical protein [Bacteroidales bacterium]